jgi:hypothetical protein
MQVMTVLLGLSISWSHPAAHPPIVQDLGFLTPSAFLQSRKGAYDPL